jgi:hypothetical protein
VLGVVADPQAKRLLDLIAKRAEVVVVGVPAAEILIQTQVHKVAEAAPAEMRFS